MWYFLHCTVTKVECRKYTISFVFLKVKRKFLDKTDVIENITTAG